MKLSKLTPEDLRRIDELCEGKGGSWELISYLRVIAGNQSPIDVRRRNMAIRELSQVRGTLRKLETALTRLTTDEIGLHAPPSVVAPRGKRYPWLKTTGASAIQAMWAALAASRARADEDPQLAFVDIAAFMARTTRFRIAVEDALGLIERPRHGRPKKLEQQLFVIGILACVYQRSTGKAASAAASGPFTELVGIVLGREKVADLIRVALKRMNPIFGKP